MPKEIYNHPPGSSPQPLPEDYAGWEALAEQSQQWPDGHKGLSAFKTNHVDRLLSERGLGHLVGTEVRTNAQLVHDRDANTHTLPGIEHTVDYLRQQGAKIPNDPIDKLAAYIDLSRDPSYINDGILTGDKRSIDRQVATRVIATSQVPESYFDTMRQTAREEGRGDLEISREMRATIIDDLQAAQRFSLKEWASYLGDTASYPDGFKMYVWDSIARLKPYDVRTESFPKRSKGTVASYPMFNATAVEKVYDLVQSGDKRGFAKLYKEAVHSLDYFDPALLQATDGMWRQFKQSYEPAAAAELSATLNDKTGWCVAQEKYAQEYLKSGDFWVYYTVDTEGEYTTPRAAIATDNNRIREIRGVLPGQAIEPQMYDTAYAKAAELPGSERYLTSREDMKRVTRIAKATEADARDPLTTNDLRFLYELDRPIGNADGGQDPRVEEIRQVRDWAADMMAVHQVGSHQELFDTILSQYQSTHNLPLLLKAKKRHPVFGYSLSNQERENARLRAVGERQLTNMVDNLPYLTLEHTSAEALIGTEPNAITDVILNAPNFGYASADACIATLADAGYAETLMRRTEDPRLATYLPIIGSTLLAHGLARDILSVDYGKGSSNVDLRGAAIEHLAGTAEVAELTAGDSLSEPVKAALENLFASIARGDRVQQIVLPTLAEVTQFEQSLHGCLSSMGVHSETFTPDKERELAINADRQPRTVARHTRGNRDSLLADVAIVDRAELRSGDLAFRNLSRHHRGKIVIAVGTKHYEMTKYASDIQGLSALSPTEINRLDPKQVAEAYEKLLAREGMPPELSTKITSPGSTSGAPADSTLLRVPR